MELVLRKKIRTVEKLRVAAGLLRSFLNPYFKDVTWRTLGKRM
jgi:hypothetical protein